MNVIVLAGGYAQRLWPLTKTLPKTLLEVAGKPVLVHVLDAIGPLAQKDQILIAIDEDRQKQFELQLKGRTPAVSPEPQLSIHANERNGKPQGPLAKIRAILDASRAYRLSKNDFLVVGGDNIFGFNVNRFRDEQQLTKRICVATRHSARPTEASQVGVPSLDERGRVVAFSEKPSGETFDLVSTACYIFPHDDLLRAKDYLASGGEDSLGHFIEWCVKNTSGVQAFVFQEDWYDTGTRRGLLAANTYLLRSFPKAPQVFIGRVTITSPVHVSDGTLIRNSEVGPNVYLGPGVRVEDSVVKDSIIYGNSVIRKSRIISSVIGANSSVEGDLNEGLVGPGTTLSFDRKEQADDGD